MRGDGARLAFLNVPDGDDAGGDVQRVLLDVLQRGHDFVMSAGLDVRSAEDLEEVEGEARRISDQLFQAILTPVLQRVNRVAIRPGCRRGAGSRAPSQDEMRWRGDGGGSDRARDPLRVLSLCGTRQDRAADRQL